MAKEEMVKLRLITAKSQSQQVIDALYDYGAIEVTRSKQAQAGVPLDSFKSISEKLINLRSFEKTLGLAQGARGQNLLPLAQLLEQSSFVEQNFEKLRITLSQLSELRGKKTSLSQKTALLNEFKEISLPASSFENTLLDFRFIKLTAKP
ncbi:hypothetical protein HY993_04405, partial [Candidatus Micrarchaeota archaeon]|nr:hypothetical protein [Candidatus Micrarchaeota archaeon]